MTPPLRRSTPAPDGRRSATPSATLHCCCSRAHCPALRRNTNIIEAVEKDAHTAAQLGQALLARHEAYKVDAERDRLELTTRIARLEMENNALVAANAAKIEENSLLLDQLEALNTTVSDADTKITLLETSLLSSNQTVRRLESTAARAADAERHLALLEQEQDRLHEELRSAREDARSYALRFKGAQRGVTDMQDQLDRLEVEASQERERHAETVQRLERQREVEKQLDAAAGRLKGAAATRSLQSDGKNNKIVGHFVRDLLQDNANLQLGIAELRELLENSNDEIQSLRGQLTYQQPTEDEDFASPASTLKAELKGKLDDHPNHIGAALSQELHIHHHYHAATPKSSKKLKRTKAGLLPMGICTPPTSLSAPATPPQSSSEWGGRLPSSPTAPALLSHARQEDLTPVSSRPPPAWNALPHRQAEMDYSSSVPSSPLVGHRLAFGSDPPTAMASPVTSVDPFSPSWSASHAKQPSVASSHSFQSLACLEPEPELPPMPRISIPEEDEAGPGHSYNEQPSDGFYTDNFDTNTSIITVPRRNLRRSASHESIMSLSGGLDIHTLQARPSQMTLRPLGGADAVVTGVTAQPTLSRSSNKRSDAALRDNVAGLKSPRTVSSPATSSQSKLRGWTAWRPWGSSGAAEAEALAADPAACESAAEAPVTTQTKAKEKERDMARSPGINQPGAIPGFQDYWASQKRKGAPARVTAQAIDRDALMDSLEGLS
ncbi:hypothetical protein ISF_06348 [Cordyceps fumosorosea ARSEF 2679]|uniref:Uncharacterized protein n=1 Tax=Cordyceps fumosorosea (strain ARSEF 2679) TaxID=1081104 RepID=A0A167SA14_CORFA|nr:hypothetical protein ISF_06348 [Cordyceps fumosorosea ARSEF 2679]OAA59413.1 hypothetical protein ISF_06348 [Cordyceps fumosorosea ARSEF 2679]